MSRTKGTRIHPEWSEEIDVARTCDICQYHEGYADSKGAWPVMTGQIKGLSGDLFDICPACWVGTVRPWLLQQAKG